MKSAPPSLVAIVGLLAAPCLSAAAAPMERGPPDTLAFYDPGLPGDIDAFGPVVSSFIPQSGAETVAPGDFVRTLQVPDASLVRVLVKAPAPAQPSKILRVAPIAAGETANDYFANALQTAISQGYAQVVFPKAVYNFAAPAANQSHLTITGASDLVIDGQGSTLNFETPLAAGVRIADSNRLVFKGFSIDWPTTLMASIGTVLSIDRAANPATMRVRIDAKYRVDASTPIIALSPWDATTNPANPHFDLKRFYKEEYTQNQGTVYLGDNVFQVPYYNYDIAVGDVFLVRHYGGAPYMSALDSGSSHDIDFENVNIYASPYLAFALSSGGGYRLSHCSVTRRDAARLISSSADAVHVADNSGDLIIEDSAFGYQGDDGLNIHGAVGGTAQPGQSDLIWTVRGEGSYAPYSWTANDPVGFFDDQHGFYGTTGFVSLSHVAAGLQINLAGPAPAGVTQIGDLARVSARFLIRNNTFSYNRARGILLESAFGVVETNDFIGQTSEGIVVGADSGTEGPGVQDVIIRDNRFSNIGSYRPEPAAPTPTPGNGAVLVGIQGVAAPPPPGPPKPAHVAVILLDNTFDDLQGPGLFLSDANAVVVARNRFVDTNRSPLGNESVGVANLGGSIVVADAHNVDLLGNTAEGATTGPVSIDTSSTTNIKVSPR